MSISDVGIANIALTALSTSRILDLEDDDENARKMNAIYVHTRDALLTEHNWNFARAQASLALLSETPTVPDYAYAFQLPTDCLRVIRSDNDVDFMIISDKAYTNANPLKIEYIRRETNPAKFSHGFVMAFAMRLAADLAYGITANATIAQLADAKAERALRVAKQSDAQEGTGTRIIQSQLITSRQQ